RTFGPAVARALEARDLRDTQDLDARGGQRHIAVALDHDVGGVTLAVQDAAAAVVDQPPRSVRDISRAWRIMVSRDHDAGRAGVHAEAPRSTAMQFQPNLGNAVGPDRSIGVGDLE